MRARGFDQGFKDEVMKSRILAWAIIWGLVAMIATQAKAFVAYETSPGVVEIRSQNDWGLQVSRVQERRMNHKKWLYFCVNDITPKFKKASTKERCFYGSPKTFSNVKVGARFRSVEYGLKNRVYNNRGRIAIGAERYFYPAYVLYQMN
jgi:hypothetical protein